ncbi:cysteine and histidine-rich domain-containing protein morgana [Neodiprion virginianus]|uniref:Cysteine and histidine-rich domain-containing protein n=1 Tax=Neodiprion lecontei TaxID=441921 RepID=A0A6J0C880_NEOLC|nr:cysteine and histidine-rich domain-containing protein morgana [Neodiprion lecontei]XP_046588455.1 cysteine and histidine-rich domain-containing protein morgana [Neodiprion lecontei]XP_046605860.1 cysteine and histidine-rich domain-containing protein morgana [Neodiprion virginianus]
MSESEEKMLHCYNRGCGKKYDPENNKEGDCIHHPGLPVFHDAYKGWSCCNKKCTDFTEFLNIKGCTKSFHTNVKPADPEKPAVDKSRMNEVIEVKPLVKNVNLSLPRPPYDSPQVTLIPVVSPALLQQIEGLAVQVTTSTETQIPIGEMCKRKGCKASYTKTLADQEPCTHHPGVPIFHEGLKYWSCCQKKTTDFSVFLEQPGCSQGTHLWLNEAKSKTIKCRMDWHQTGGFVVVSIFCKKYQPSRSNVRLNPVRLTVDLYFQEEDSRYELDVELRGVVNVEESSVNMLPTKVEIKLKKAEPGTWAKLETANPTKTIETPPVLQSESEKEESITAQVDAVDLSDL